MKLKLLALSVAMSLLSSATSYAGDGYLTKIGRALGYGISDGYHAQRYSVPGCSSCNGSSPVQQPMMMQPLRPQPTAAAHSLRPASQFQHAGYPVGYPTMSMSSSWYQPQRPAYRQPTSRW